MAERVEHGLVQQFVAQPPIERLHERVLYRLARLYVMPGDAVSCCQRSIAVDVSSLPLSLTMHRGLPRTAMIACHAGARERGVCHQPKAFAREVVDHAQNPEAAAIGEGIRHEVERPAFVGSRRHCHRRAKPERPLPHQRSRPQGNWSSRCIKLFSDRSMRNTRYDSRHHYLASYISGRHHS